MTDKPVTIRKLLRKDRVILTGLLSEFAEKREPKIRELISATTEATAGRAQHNSMLPAVALQMLTAIVELLDDKAAAWFADLIGVSVEDFNNMPFGVDAEIIGQIIASEEFESFFSHLSGISKAVNALRTVNVKPRNK
jgi:hypothetical protein